MGKALLLAACGAALLCGVALLGASIHFKAHATPDPTPSLNVTDIEARDEEGFPKVDWAYWKSVNPDIIGWLTVPETSIDLPIAQAHMGEPDFYLTHDIYRGWNYLGCPYLDAECEKLGLNSRCAMVYGHNSDDGSMFAGLANYSDQEFAERHSRILLQTPDSKRVLQVAAVSLVKGSDASNRLRFESDADFRAWYKDRVKSSFFQLGSLKSAGGEAVVNGGDAGPNSVVALCTCSYNFWPDDERTIIYAVDALGGLDQRDASVASER